MEYTSMLAGERWSDHPACTHPLLAALARGVNDRLGDAARQELLLLAPELVGLVGDDPLLDARLARWCAQCALPVAAADAQQALAVGVLVAERVLAAADGRAEGEVSPASRAALAQVPLAAAWAAHFVQSSDPSAEGFLRTGAHAVVRVAERGIAQACVGDVDRRLVAMLRGAVRQFPVWTSGPWVPGPRLGGRGAGRRATGPQSPLRWRAALTRPTWLKAWGVLPI